MNDANNNSRCSSEWRALYGELDPFAVAPFIEHIGEPLSNEGRRLASLLNRAMRGRLPITTEIRFELVHFLSAPFRDSDLTKGRDRRLYGMELHRQKLIALLERYGRRPKRRRVRLTIVSSSAHACSTDQPDGPGAA